MRYLLAALALLTLAMPADASPSTAGYAARYRSDRLMWRAAEIHGVRVPPGRSVCASPTQKLGTLLKVVSRVKGREGRILRCIVGDIAHSRDRASIIRRGIVVELAPSGALHVCGTIAEPPAQCKVRIEGG
jgi:hypothetical protein